MTCEKRLQEIKQDKNIVFCAIVSGGYSQQKEIFTVHIAKDRNGYCTTDYYTDEGEHASSSNKWTTLGASGWLPYNYKNNLERDINYELNCEYSKPYMVEQIIINKYNIKIDKDNVSKVVRGII